MSALMHSLPIADQQKANRPGRSLSPPNRREADLPRVCEGSQADAEFSWNHTAR